MKRLSCIVFCAGLLTVSLHSVIRAQSSLTPPEEAIDDLGRPIATMKSLDHVEPRQAIYFLPYVISAPGSYYLVRNLVATDEGDGISITCSDVQLDLAGFALSGGPGSLSGINVISPNIENITIRNGVLRGWGQFGINATNARDVVIGQIKSSHNGWGGIYAGENAFIEQCNVYGNGFQAVGENPPMDGGIYTKSFGNVINCIVRNNHGAGITVGNHSKVLGCNATESQNADGIRAASYCTIRDCVAARNRGNGIYVGSLSRVVENTCGQNGVYPFERAYSAGIVANGNNNIIEKNIVVGNEIGIRTVGDGNLVINNSASANNYPFQFQGLTHRGPVITPDGQLSADTSPWANFAFQ